MVKFSSKYRSTEDEIMDNFQLQGELMKELLNDLKRINKWLGGNRITENGVLKLLVESPSVSKLTIVDLGCGDGEMLRVLSNWAKKKQLELTLIGLDANEYILQEAVQKSTPYPNISFKKIDVFSEEPNVKEVDIVVCTLFLHHFRNEEIQTLISKWGSKARIGMVINDLHRSRIAFILFKLIRLFIVKTKIAKHDGLVSIARGFKKRELKELIRRTEMTTASLQWKWAFRYQCIVSSKKEWSK